MASSNFEIQAVMRCLRQCPTLSELLHFCSPFEYPFRYLSVVNTLKLTFPLQLQKFDYFGDIRVDKYLVHLMVISNFSCRCQRNLKGKVGWAVLGVKKNNSLKAHENNI